ncbi:hypothetical protein ES332_D02G089600v1 [Gossypium tomentosum]|uniref:Uncharacterized protein n=1 Tax=Gossypium tomentosum TaxID=34277 RepID=A0A5D2LUW6_GOSTO|nr:hypothetical protein ES332_D02G089600v1 [Gossypium tomentosum]
MVPSYVFHDTCARQLCISGFSSYLSLNQPLGISGHPSGFRISVAHLSPCLSPFLSLPCPLSFGF